MNEQPKSFWNVKFYGFFYERLKQSRPFVMYVDGTYGLLIRHLFFQITPVNNSCGPLVWIYIKTLARLISMLLIMQYCYELGSVYASEHPR